MNVDVLAVVSCVKLLAVGSYEAILGSAEVVCPAAVYCKLDLIVKILVYIFKGDLIDAFGNLAHQVSVVVGIPVGIVEPVVLTVADRANFIYYKFNINGNAVACYGDLLCLGIEGNGYVASLGNVELNVSAGSVAVTLCPVVICNDLELDIVGRLYVCEGDAVLAVLTLGHVCSCVGSIPACAEDVLRGACDAVFFLSCGLGGLVGRSYGSCCGLGGFCGCALGSCCGLSGFCGCALGSCCGLSGFCGCGYGLILCSQGAASCQIELEQSNVVDGNIVVTRNVHCPDLSVGDFCLVQSVCQIELNKGNVVNINDAVGIRVSDLELLCFSRKGGYGAQA